jgi:hypothetical protein
MIWTTKYILRVTFAVHIQHLFAPRTSSWMFIIITAFLSAKSLWIPHGGYLAFKANTFVFVSIAVKVISVCPYGCVITELDKTRFSTKVHVVSIGARSVPTHLTTVACRPISWVQFDIDVKTSVRVFTGPTLAPFA